LVKKAQKCPNHIEWTRLVYLSSKNTMLINNHIKYLLKSPDTSQSSERTTGLISVKNPKISKPKRKFCKTIRIMNIQRSKIKVTNSWMGLKREKK